MSNDITHIVHVYSVVRTPVQVRNAPDQALAIEAALGLIDWHQQFDRESPGQEWAEEHAYFLVDEAGDEEYVNSQWYSENGTEYQFLAATLDILGNLLAAEPALVSKGICWWCRSSEDDHDAECVAEKGRQAIKLGIELIATRYIPQRKRPA